MAAHVQRDAGVCGVALFGARTTQPIQIALCALEVVNGRVGALDKGCCKARRSPLAYQTERADEEHVENGCVAPTECAYLGHGGVLAATAAAQDTAPAGTLKVRIGGERVNLSAACGQPLGNHAAQIGERVSGAR